MTQDNTPTQVNFEEIPEIRRIWHNGTWYYSVIDVIAFLVQASTPRKYWTTLKSRLRTEGSQATLEEIEALPLKASDGRMRNTDTASMQTLLRLIQSIPSPRVEVLKQWLAQVGSERIEEIENPQAAIERIRAEYRAKGRDEKWIEERIRNGMIRNDLTDEWSERGIQEGMQIAILTNELHTGTFSLSVQAHRRYKTLPGKENLRDHMSRMELVLTSLSEETAIQLHQTNDSQGFNALKQDTVEAGQTAGEARKLVEERLGKPVVSPENFLEQPTSKSKKRLKQSKTQPELFSEEEGK